MPAPPLTACRHETYRVPTPDGLTLHVQAWLPPTPRGTVLIVHGLADHSGRYAWAAQRLTGEGWACYAVDCHGLSPGPRVHVGGFAEFRRDVAAAQAWVLGRHPSPPHFLLGHSQGGLVVLDYVLPGTDAVTGIVLTSPFLRTHPDSKPGAGVRFAAAVLDRIWPSVLLPNAIHTSWVSRGEGVVDAYRSDPLVSRRVSPRWFRSLTATQDDVGRRAGELRKPALVLWAGADRLVDPAATRAFVAAAPPALVEGEEWPGLYHELLNEPERDRVLARIARWLSLKG